MHGEQRAPVEDRGRGPRRRSGRAHPTKKVKGPKKSYTTEAMVDQLEAIKADRELPGHTYKRRYKLTRKQNSILSCFDLSEKDIDEQCESLT